MSDEPLKIDDLKEEERLKIDVEDVAPSQASEQDVVDEFKKLGRQFTKRWKAFSPATRPSALRMKYAKASRVCQRSEQVYA
ncbi:MAG: hypothetical protein R3C44_10940 [Chloroflexota bacterium]